MNAEKRSNCRMSRRRFIGSCAACSASMAVIPLGGTSLLADSASAVPLVTVKTRMKLIFAYPSPENPIWPNIGYDFEKRKKEILAQITKACPDVIFDPIDAMKNEDAEGILKSSDDADGFIVYLIGCLWGNVTESIGASGKPVIVVDDLFAGTGEFLTSYARLKREGRRVIGVSSSDFGDVVRAVETVASLKRLSASTVLVIGSSANREIQDLFGTKILSIDFEALNQCYRNVNPADSRKCADRWIKNAEKVIEPSREDIDRAGTMYLAMFDLMKRNAAQAIAVHCLSGIYSGKLVEAYPCLGFMQLNDDGLVGACEADQRSTITMLLMKYLVDRPGFISDPVIDTSKNRIIYAHCVAPTRVFGTDGPKNPYHIRDHSEDRKGACNRSLMPLGEKVTTILFDAAKKQVIMHQGVTVENVEDDKACRNKLAIEVSGDVFRLLEEWDRWGWHRVTFYGDFKRRIYDVASLLGMSVVEEA